MNEFSRELQKLNSAYMTAIGKKEDKYEDNKKILNRQINRTLGAIKRLKTILMENIPQTVPSIEIASQRVPQLKENPVDKIKEEIEKLESNVANLTKVKNELDSKLKRDRLIILNRYNRMVKELGEKYGMDSSF
jgi:archaellum component FlaC